MVIVENNTIYCADSLGQRPFEKNPRNVLQIVRSILLNIVSNHEWIIKMNDTSTYCNYIVQVLKYEIQKDSNSCCFYVLSTLCHFSESVGELHPFPSIQYDEKITEMYRESAVRACMKRVKEIYVIKEEKSIAEAREKQKERRKTRVSDQDVTIHICREIMRFFTSFETPQ